MAQSSPNGIARFEELARPHLDALLRTATRLAGNAAVADDLVQDTLLRGLRFIDRYEDGTNFKAWIFRILFNTHINEFRRRRRSAENPTAPFDLDRAVAATPPADADGTFVARTADFLDNVDDRLRNAVLSLPESLRWALMLSVVEGLSYQEIAEVLDCPMGTVMSRLFRARAVLREKAAAPLEDSRFRNEPKDRSEAQRDS